MVFLYEGYMSSLCLCGFALYTLVVSFHSPETYTLGLRITRYSKWTVCKNVSVNDSLSPCDLVMDWQIFQDVPHPLRMTVSWNYE